MVLGQGRQKLMTQQLICHAESHKKLNGFQYSLGLIKK
jgi:hypothetical protein